jgi:hypothetical protein
MSTPSPHDPLSRTLAAWRVTPPADPAFRPAVWQRLAAARDESWPGYLRAHLAVWCVTALIASAAAGWAGRSVAHAQLDADRERMIFSYLGELDPRVLAQVRP